MDALSHRRKIYLDRKKITLYPATKSMMAEKRDGNALTS